MLPYGYWFRRQFTLAHFNLDENIYQGCGIIESSSVDRAINKLPDFYPRKNSQ